MFIPESDPLTTLLQKWVGAFMHRSMQDFIRFAKGYGLSMSQIGALFHIRQGVSGVSDIGENLGVTSAAASQMLERLVQAGWVIRSEDQNDRRVKQIVLTEKGQELLEAGIRARESWMFDLMKLLTLSEREQVAGALNILIERTKQVENTP